MRRIGSRPFPSLRAANASGTRHAAGSGTTAGNSVMHANRRDMTPTICAIACWRGWSRLEHDRHGNRQTAGFDIIRPRGHSTLANTLLSRLARFAPGRTNEATFKKLDVDSATLAEFPCVLRW